MGDVDSLHFGYLSRLPVVLVHKANDSVADYEPRKFQYICQRVSGKQELIARRRRRREEREKKKTEEKTTTHEVCVLGDDRVSPHRCYCFLIQSSPLPIKVSHSLRVVIPCRWTWPASNWLTSMSTQTSLTPLCCQRDIQQKHRLLS